MSAAERVSKPGSSSSLLAERKIIIEVGLNEAAKKSSNPNVPYGVDEVISDAIACAEAGASIVHFHARDATGNQIWDADDIYRAEMEAVARGSEVLMYPSYFETFDIIDGLLDSPPRGAPLRIVPFDVYQSVGQVNWNEQTRSFEPSGIDWMRADAAEARPGILDRCLREGVIPTVCVQELGHLRWTNLALRAAILRAPVALKIFVMGSYVRGPEPTPEGLDALLSHVTPDMEPMIVPSRMTSRDVTERLLRHALSQDVHIRVGIGDNPAAFGVETNAELVEWAVQLAAEYGYSPAGVADVLGCFGTGDERPHDADGTKSTARRA